MRVFQRNLCVEECILSCEVFCENKNRMLINVTESTQNPFPTTIYQQHLFPQKNLLMKYSFINKFLPSTSLQFINKLLRNFSVHCTHLNKRRNH